MPRSLPAPEYSVAEGAANGLIFGMAVLRGGHLTDRQRRRLERNKDNALLRAERRAAERCAKDCGKR